MATQHWKNEDTVKLLKRGDNVQHSDNRFIYREGRYVKEVMEFMYPRREALIAEILAGLTYAPEDIEKAIDILVEDGDVAVIPFKARIPKSAKVIESGSVDFSSPKTKVPSAEDYLGLNQAFSPLGNLVAPTEEALSGKVEHGVYEDVFGPARTKPGKNIMDL